MLVPMSNPGTLTILPQGSWTVKSMDLAMATMPYRIFVSDGKVTNAHYRRCSL